MKIERKLSFVSFHSTLPANKNQYDGLCCHFYLRYTVYLQYMTDLAYLIFCLFTSEPFVFILQSGSAVLHFTLKACLTSDCPTLIRPCVCGLAKDASSADRLPYVWQIALLVSLPDLLTGPVPWKNQNDAEN